ncbi:MAG: aldose epimerase family protein [Acidobacteriota bacterium]
MNIATARMTARRTTFGTTPAGTQASLFELEEPGVLKARITDYGGAIVGLETPDREGRLADVVQGFDSLDGYLDPENPYMGAIVGRFANRIAGGRFRLGSREVELATNNGPNSLHGGERGFSHTVWRSEIVETDDSVGVVLRHRSEDGDEGYPGALDCTVSYQLRAGGGLLIESEATCDATTVVNLTFHAYFNLEGHAAGSVLDHRLRICAERFTPLDETQIPMGSLIAVAETPFDFRRSKRLGRDIDADDEQIQRGSGFDHNWVVDGWNVGESVLRQAARLEAPESGRVLELSTTEPGLQVYTANFLDGTLRGKGGQSYARRSSVCLEPQHFPDSPNQPQFPPTVLEPGDVYRQRTLYRFSVAP